MSTRVDGFITSHRRRRWLGALIFALAAAVNGSPAVQADAQAASFVETFDGAPATPTPWISERWDIAVHSRDLHTWHRLESMAAHHGPACSPPSEAHRANTYEDAVFQCRDHLMTSINASGYGVIYLTPDHMVDFSRGEAVVRFDVSTLRSSTRDWWDLWLTPYPDNLQMPLEAWYPDLAGPPANAVQITLNDANTFIPRVYRDHHEEVVTSQWWTGYDSVLEPSASRRDTMELRISRTHIRFGMPAYDYWPVDADIADLGWDQAVVQLGHHSYNPTKGGTGPNTWHWDNVGIEPAVPFTIIQADRRYVGPDSQGAIAFDRPAPEASHLRFSGMGDAFQISTDGGVTWQAAAKPSQVALNGPLFSNYWTPIPEGTTEIHLRGSQGWLSSWIAKDFAIWSLPGADGSQASRPAMSEPVVTTPTDEGESAVGGSCPASWRRGRSCLVPDELQQHLRRELGDRAADDAVAAITGWYVTP